MKYLRTRTKYKDKAEPVEPKYFSSEISRYFYKNIACPILIAYLLTSFISCGMNMIKSKKEQDREKIEEIRNALTKSRRDLAQIVYSD